MILSRLREALRRQDGFAVALELVIVVVGVVVGFQVTAWGERRAAADKERTYLRQLAADLAETERIVAERDASMDRRTHDAALNLVAALGAEARPPRDSLARWLSRLDYVASPRPVLGTVEALVASGDFGGVRDDSLRAAILRYQDRTREFMADQTAALVRTQSLLLNIRRRYGRFSLAEAQSDLDEGAVRTYLTGPDSTHRATADWRDPSPVDVYAIYDDPAYLDLLEELVFSFLELRNLRRVFAESAGSLREQVEATLSE